MCRRRSRFVHALCPAVFMALSGIPATALETAPMHPAPGAADVVTNTPPLQVSLTGGSEPAKVTFFHRQSPSPVRPNFTIAVFPDTQNLVAGLHGATPEVFYAQADWVATNRASRNIVYAAHMGDIVQNVNLAENEWWVATNALYRLENPHTTGLPEGLPYGVTPGNHDGPPYTFYNKYFGPGHFAGRSYYGGHLDAENNSNFVLFSAAGLEFISVQIEQSPGSNALAWANEVISTHSNRHAIVVSHDILFPAAQGTIFDQRSGQRIYDSVKVHPNVFLMLCGHQPVTGIRTDVYNGSTITSLLQDYSWYSIASNGWMRLLEFMPSNNAIKVSTFSPSRNEYWSANMHEFTIPLNMSLDGKGYSLVETVNVPTAADQTVETLALPALAGGMRYDWFVKVESASTNYTSPVWSFTTRAVTNPPAPAFKILAFGADSQGRISFEWASVGQRRYRIEVCDGGPGGTFSGRFEEILRPDAQEVDPSPEGMSSTQRFVDTYEYTQGPPPHGARFFRVREMR